MPDAENQATVYAVLLELTPLIIRHVTDQAPKDKKDKIDIDLPKGLFFYQCLWLLSRLSSLAVLHNDVALVHFLNAVIPSSQPLKKKRATQKELIQQLDELIGYVVRTKDILVGHTNVPPPLLTTMGILCHRLRVNLGALKELNPNFPQISFLKKFTVDKKGVLDAEKIFNRTLPDDYKIFRVDVAALRKFQFELKSCASAVTDQIKECQNEATLAENEALNLRDDEEEIKREIEKLGKKPRLPFLAAPPDKVTERCKVDLIANRTDLAADSDRELTKLQRKLHDFVARYDQQEDFSRLLTRDREVLTEIRQELNEEESRLSQAREMLHRLETARRERQEANAVVTQLRKQLQAACASAKTDSPPFQAAPPEEEEEKGDEKEEKVERERVKNIESIKK